MASTNKTTNLLLPQWQLDDKPEMNDYNDAFGKIDTAVSAHLADYAAVGSNESFWSGYASSGIISFAKNTSDFMGILIETNANPQSATYRGVVFMPSYFTSNVVYLPAMYGDTPTWIRVSLLENSLNINSVGNVGLNIISVIGIGKKPKVV